ncbi:MAG: hypothetical protein AB7F98_13910 [Novosphingobium sp.]
MPKCKIVALTTPKPGQEKEFADWYQNTHLPEMTSFAGSQGAQRFQLVAKMMGADTNQFLAIYDIECDDPGAYLAAVGAAAQAGKLTPGTWSQDETTYTALFVECGDYVKGVG